MLTAYLPLSCWTHNNDRAVKEDWYSIHSQYEEPTGVKVLLEGELPNGKMGRVNDFMHDLSDGFASTTS